MHFQLALSNYTVKPCNFQLDEQIFTHCYFLSVLIPEPVLYIWRRLELCIRYFLAHFASHSVIFQTQPRIFWTQLLNFCLRLSAKKIKNLAKNNMYIYLGRTNLVTTEYREYFMETAGVRCVRTSCWRIRNRTSERSEQVRFLIQKQRVRKYRTKHFPCGIVFII